MPRKKHIFPLLAVFKIDFEACVKHWIQNMCVLVHFALEWSLIAIKTVYFCLLLFGRWIFLPLNIYRPQKADVSNGFRPLYDRKNRKWVWVHLWVPFAVFPWAVEGSRAARGLRWQPPVQWACRLCHLPSQCSPSSLQESTTLTLQVLKCTEGWHNYKKIKKLGVLYRAIVSHP